MAAATLAETARRLNLAARDKWRLAPGAPLPPLILMTDVERLANPAPAIRALPPGSAVIYRHYEIADRLGLGQALRRIAREHGILFLVAGDRSLAHQLEADGCHMPEALSFRLEEGPAFERADGRPAFNTLAAHSHEALERAAHLGVDAALLSPVFATKSHLGDEPLGAREANQLAQEARLPVYALGGLTAQTAVALSERAFAGIAAIGALS